MKNAKIAYDLLNSLESIELIDLRLIEFKTKMLIVFAELEGKDSVIFTEIDKVKAVVGSNLEVCISQFKNILTTYLELKTN